MMPLAPERSTICLPARPKADFSIDFIVGNAKKSSGVANSSSNNNNNNSPPRKGPTSPLSGRRASPRSPPHPVLAEDLQHHHHHHQQVRSRTSAASPESLDDEDEVRARLLGLQAAQAALPAAGALHGLMPPLGLPLGLGMPRVPQGEPSPVSPASPSSPHSSPPHSPPHHSPLGPQPLLFRSLYRPEPLLVPHQFQGMAPHMQHPHLGAPPGMHPGVHPGVHPQHPHPHQLPPKDSYPLYPWLLSRHGRIFPHRFPGPDFAGFLLHPFRKPKRIRTAFSPSQLLKLEHAFENNHYVVGAERKQVAQALGLSETQVKVWFQNRRTKHKRTEQEEESKVQRSKQGGGGGGGECTSNSSQHTEEKESDRRLSSPLSPTLSHRPVDLSSHEDSSRTDSES